MDIKPVRTDADHRAALHEIERLWDYPAGSAENDKLDVLATLVEAYEQRRWPTEACSPTEILRFAISDLGRTQTDLARLLGSRSTASEILSGKRPVSLEAARKISASWQIPIQLLVVPHRSSAA